jgi:hypothetical protein
MFSQTRSALAHQVRQVLHNENYFGMKTTTWLAASIRMRSRATEPGME